MSFLDKATPVNQATSTPSFANKAKPVNQTQSTPVVETPVKEDGFFKSLAKDVAGTLVVKPVANTTEALGRLGLFGSNIKKGYEDISDTGKGQNIMGINVEKQRGFQEGGVKQILGETAKTASYLYGGGALPNIARSTLGGKVLSGLVQGTKAGAVSGALYGGGQEAIKQESTVGSITKQAGIGGLIGGATGGVIGGVLPIPVASVQNIKPTNIMQRVARVNPLDEQKFQQTAKESIGEYLVKRGIYGNDEEIMKQLAQRFSQSKQVADEALEKLPGTYRPEPVKTALKEMLERETRISSPGAPSRDLARVQNLVTKYENKGVTMPEINEIKRIFERNNRLDYLKQNLPESIAKANTLDDAIRGWQFNQSKQLGLKNLDEVNKETRLAKQLGDALFKKNVRGSGNNAFGLTDAVLLSGGDPQAISMFLARQTFGNKNIQSKIAKTIAGKPTVGTPTAVFGSKVSPKQAIPDVIIGKSKQNIPDVVVGSRASKPVNAVIPVTNTKLQAFKAGQGNSQGGYIANPFQGKPKPKVNNQVVSLTNDNMKKTLKEVVQETKSAEDFADIIMGKELDKVSKVLNKKLDDSIAQGKTFPTEESIKKAFPKEFLADKIAREEKERLLDELRKFVADQTQKDKDFIMQIPNRQTIINSFDELKKRMSFKESGNIRVPAEVRANIVEILDDYTLNGGKNKTLQEDAARIAEDFGITLPKRYGDLVKRLGEFLDKQEINRQVN